MLFLSLLSVTTPDLVVQPLPLASEYRRSRRSSISPGRRGRTRESKRQAGSAGEGWTYYANCAAARAAGAAPVMRGDPGYAPKLDRDNDGIGCE